MTDRDMIGGEIQYGKTMVSGPALFACPWLLLLGLSSLSGSDVCSHKILAVHTSQQHDNSDKRHTLLQNKLLLLLFSNEKATQLCQTVTFTDMEVQTLNILLCLGKTRGVRDKDICSMKRAVFRPVHPCKRR